MDKEAWIAIKKYYAQLPEMSEEEQEALLRKLTEEQPEQAAVLRSLISDAGQTAADPVLDLPAISKIKDSDKPIDHVGRIIGKYKLTFLIGIGGMGRVYLADRLDLEAHQQVAIKIISAGYLTEVYKKRFDRERKILSRLNHPHITRIYDGGITEEGTPYIIMEYVEGKPLMEYVSDNELNLEQRLELFIDLCEAVDYAHRNFVMHRDLKPGNILVTNHGIVKVIDFGIAKILEDDSGEEDLTIMGYIPLTPAYASPEQLKGEPLTVASDIFSLGVILYQLVSGNKPYPGSTKSNMALAERIHHRSALPKPSSKLDPNIAPDLKAWQKQLKGDIDNIVLKALKDSPEERYSSAAQLAEDLQRYQKNYPVMARPDSAWYLFSKYARRNTAIVTLGLLVVLILLAGVGATLWQADKAAQQRDQAQMEAERAQEISRFLTELFDYSDPDRAAGAVISSETMLERGSAKLEGLQGRPNLQAEMYRLIGELYSKQHLYDQAEAHLLKALEIFEVQKGAQSLDPARTKLHLAEIYSTQNRTRETLELSEAAANLFAERLGKESLEHNKAQNYRARAEMQAGNYAVALEILLEAAERVEQLDLDNALVARVLTSLYNDIAGAYSGMGQRLEYLHYLKRALAIMLDTEGETSQNVAAVYNNIGHAYYFMAEYDSALYYTLNALSIADELYRDQANDRSRFAHCNLAKTYIYTGQLPQALEHAEQCYAQSLQVYEEVHPFTAFALSVIGDAYLAMGDHKNSESHRRQATSIYESYFQGADPKLAWHYWDEAERYFKSGKLIEAIDFKRRCIDVYRQTMPEATGDIAEAEYILAGFLLQSDSLELALPLLESALNTFEKEYPPGDERTLKAMRELIEVYEQSEYAEAAAQLSSHLSALEVEP